MRLLRRLFQTAEVEPEAVPLEPDSKGTPELDLTPGPIVPKPVPPLSAFFTAESGALLNLAQVVQVVPSPKKGRCAERWAIAHLANGSIVELTKDDWGRMQ